MISGVPGSYRPGAPDPDTPEVAGILRDVSGVGASAFQWNTPAFDTLVRMTWDRN